jgi:hypothetical protein
LYKPTDDRRAVISALIFPSSSGADLGPRIKPISSAASNESFF